MGTPWVLAVDLGTGGPKVGAVGLDGSILATAFTPVPTIATHDGGVEQDVTLWWDGIRAGVRSFLDAGVVRGDDLHAVGLTSQWMSMVAVDGDGAPVGPCLMWSDRRGEPQATAAVGGPVAGLAPDVIVRAVRYTGMVPLPSGEDPLGHELFLRANRPEQYRRARALLEPVDYLGLRFTGVIAATPASQFTSALVDNRPGRIPRRPLPRAPQQRRGGSGRRRQGVTLLQRVGGVVVGLGGAGTRKGLHLDHVASIGCEYLSRRSMMLLVPAAHRLHDISAKQ